MFYKTKQQFPVTAPNHIGELGFLGIQGVLCRNNCAAGSQHTTAGADFSPTANRIKSGGFSTFKFGYQNNTELIFVNLTADSVQTVFDPLRKIAFHPGQFALAKPFHTSTVEETLFVIP